MGLKKSDSTVSDLKATFFDVFCDHTEELAALIEVLATDPTADAMQIESIIFQRIIMLNKTVGNIRGLVSNVDDLNMVRGVGLKNSNVVNSSVDKKEVTNGVNSNVATTVPQTTVAPTVVPTTVPQQTVTPPVVPTTAPQQIVVPSAVPTTAPQQIIPTTVPIATTAPVVKPSVIPPTAPQRSMTQILTQNSAIKAPVKNSRLSFIKSSDNKVKAILVNDNQFNKLMSSRIIQTKRLGFDMVSSPDRGKIEELMKKASALYKEGKISEAQALYAEISSLNKQLKKEDNKVLTKVA